MIEVEIYENSKLVGKIYAKYYGQYTNNPCGYEYFTGLKHPQHVNPGFVRQLVQDLDRLGARFRHASLKKPKWVTGDEVFELLCLERG